jgi:tetratricopeptide (TPR) repeat protein
VNSLRSVEVAEQCAASATLCGSLAELGGALGLGGLNTLALRYLDRAARTAEQSNDPHGLAYVHMVRGLYFVGRGDWRLAAESTARCQSICETIRDSINWGNAQIVRFWLEYYRGQSSAAENAAAALLTRAERVGNRQQEGWALRGLALLRLHQGEIEGALARIQASHAILLTQDSNEFMPTLATLALARLRANETSQALETAWQALALAKKLGRPTGHGILAGLTAIAEIALWTSDSNLMLAAIERLDAYRRVFPIGVPAYFRCAGLCARRLEKTRRARHYLKRAVEAAASLGMATEQGLAEYALLAGTAGAPHTADVDCAAV